MQRKMRPIRSAGTAASRLALCVLAAVSLLGYLSSRAPAQRPDPNTTMPQVIHKVEPGYTDQARDAHIEGTVVLAVQIGKDGTVQDVSVKRSLEKGLDENAMAAVRQWKFKPGTRDGEPVTVNAAIEVNFRLK